MRNALLPSLSSQFYSFESNEVQIPDMDFSMQMDSEVNVHGGGFCMKSMAFDNDNLQLRNGCFSVPYQSLINYSYQSGYQSGTGSCADFPQQSMLLSKKLSVPQFQTDLQAMPNAKKRQIEVKDVLPKIGIDMVGNTTTLNECKNNKRNKATTSEQQWPQHQVRETSMDVEEHRLHVPVRRSQKLSDKITALQKLVSPYGKTDTASVLQEASLYIKLIHEQIQMLSSSYNSVRTLHRQEIGKSQLDLRSRGLCLVPVSFTRKVKMEGHVNHHAI